jgi:hypothetical protein
MHGGAVVNDTTTQHNFIANTANAGSKVCFALEHKLHSLVLTSANEAADLLNTASAHIEVVDSDKHVCWFQLPGGLRWLIRNEVLDIQIVVSADFKHDTNACVG